MIAAHKDRNKCVMGKACSIRGSQQPSRGIESARFVSGAILSMFEGLSHDMIELIGSVRVHLKDSFNQCTPPSSLELAACIVCEKMF